MATSTPAPKRLSDLVRTKANRPIDRDAVLLSIEGQEVEVASVDIDPAHQGRFRTYPLTKVTLTDGRTFSVAGKAVAEPFGYLEPSDFPITVAFRRAASDFDPEATYWTVE